MNCDAIHGAILGAVVGDAIGLPYEALSARRGAKLLGPPDRHRFVLGRGMMSDDGEHTCMVAKALIDSAFVSDVFQRKLAWQFRWWLLGMPAGIGGATLRAIVKLWLGFPPSRSGVFSAGNGPAMRSAVIGVAAADFEQLRALTRASTVLTHTDPKAYEGALAIALAARCASEGKPPGSILGILRHELAGAASELPTLLEQAIQSAARGESTRHFASSIGCGEGVTGYIYHTVPVAIHAWAAHPTDYRAAIVSAVECGGDTDSVAACVGGIVGSHDGPAGIPLEWRDGLLEWPRSLEWIENLARSLSSAHPPAHRGVGPLVVFRNLFFALVVLIHIVRRTLPPY